MSQDIAWRVVQPVCFNTNAFKTKVVGVCLQGS